jgi:hypothetical protein
MTTHVPLRPTWTCVGCGQLWPCPTRRRELLAEFSGSSVGLGLYLSACLVEASAQLPDVLAGELYSRFVGWSRRWTVL